MSYLVEMTGSQAGGGKLGIDTEVKGVPESEARRRAQPPPSSLEDPQVRGPKMVTGGLQAKVERGRYKLVRERAVKKAEPDGESEEKAEGKGRSSSSSTRLPLWTNVEEQDMY